MPNLPEANFDAVAASPEALQAWLSGIAGFGFAKFNNGPLQTGALTQVVGLFGHLRETNYGRIFEVGVEEKPVKLAYTSLVLKAHRQPLSSSYYPSALLLRKLSTRG